MGARHKAGVVTEKNAELKVEVSVTPERLKMPVYTPKQLALLRLWQRGGLRRLNVLEGSVRSGKTWISLVLWAFWVATGPAEGCYLMVAKTLSSLKRNCLDLLQQLVGTRKFSYSTSKKEAVLFGRRVFLEGAGDARAEGKIRGMTLNGAYCDELSLFDRDFFVMLLSRLSLPGAKLFATTNPDHPHHWLKREYLDRAGELDLLDWQFLVTDNSFLDPHYVAQLQREYTGVFYRRFILGQWVAADGLVYEFDPERQVATVLPTAGEYYISVDYGTQNPCSMGLWCVAGGVATRIDEFYYSGRQAKKQLTDEEYYQALEGLAGERLIRYVVVDPSAASFIETIRRHGRFVVKKADNRVLDGIRLVANMLAAGVVKIGANCEAAIREFGVYAWDPEATEDRPLKADDHAMDEIRYFCGTVLKRELGWR